MNRFRTGLLWFHTASVLAVALFGFQYTSKPIPEISLLVEVVHHAVTSWFYPEPFLAFFILAFSGWLFSTFGLFSSIRYAIGSSVSLLLFAWWAVLLGPGELLHRLPEFLLLGSVLVGVSALAPFRPVSLLALNAVRFGILPVMTLHRVSSSLNKLLCFVIPEKFDAVSTLARHAARSRTDFLLTRVHGSFSLKVDSALLTDLVAALKDESLLGSVHIDRLSMVYSTLMLVESHQDSEYHSDALLEMFEWDAERSVTSCYEIFDANPKTEDRICASSTLFKEKQWGLLLHNGESLVTYPIWAVKLRAAREILEQLEDSNTPEYREVSARQDQLMRELHLTGSLSEGCVLAPTSSLSLSKRSQSRHLQKSGFSAPFSFASLPIFDGTPGLQLATFFIVLLSAWFTTDEIGLELGNPLRRFGTAYLPESDPRRVTEDDRITDIHTLSGQPIVARVHRKQSDVLQDGYLRIDPQNYDIDVINLPLDLVSSSRVLVDSFQAPNGFHILTGSSADSKSNLAHFLLPPEGSKQSDWRTVHAPMHDFDLGAILDSRWMTPDMQFIVGGQGMCLYRPSAITVGQNGYQFLPYATPAGATVSDALLTQSELHLVFEYAGEVHYSQTSINSIKKTFESSQSSLQALFVGSRVLPRFEIGEDFQIHPGPSNSVFVQGSQGSLLHIDGDIHIVRWGHLPELRTPEFVFLGDYALAFDQSQLLLHRSAESEPSSWWATKNLTLGEDGALNEVDLFSEPLPDCFLAVHESDSQTQLTLLVHKRPLKSETGLLYRFKIDRSGRISDGELFIPDVVDFSVSSDGQNCALTARFSRSKDDKANYEVLLTFSSELAGTQDFDHGEQDRLSAFQKFLPLALFDNRNQLAVRSPMPPAFVGQQLALSYDLQNELHSILTSSGEIQAYSEARLSSVGNVEQLPSFPAGKNVTVDFFTDRGVNHVLTVQPNHQVDRWKGQEHQAFSWHYPRWGSSRPNGNRVVLSPGSDDFVISDGVSLYHHAVSGGWRPLKSPLNGRPLPADQLFSLSTEPNRDSLLFSIVADGLFSTLLEVKSGGGGVQRHRLSQKIDQGNSSWMLSPAESPNLVFRSTDSDGAARWFSWDKEDSESLLHSADSSNAAGKVIDLCDMDVSSENEGLLILGEKGLNYCRNTQSGFIRQFISHLDLDDSGSLFKPSQLVDTSSDFVWALYESGDETKPALVTPSLKVLQKQPTLLASSVTTDDGQGFVGLSRRTREPVQFGSSTECISLLPNARFTFEPERLEVVRWLPGQDHLHLVARSSGQPNKKSLLTLDGFGRLQQSVPNLRFDGDIQSAHLVGSTTHVFTDQSWYSLSGTEGFTKERSGRWFANSFPDEQAGLAWRVGNAEGTEPAGKATGLGALSKLQLPGARAQSSGSPSRVVPAFSGIKGDYYLAAERGMYRWGGLAQGFTSFPIPESGAKDIRTWLRSDRGGAPIAVVSRSGGEPSFHQFDFNTKSFVDLGIDLKTWSQDSPEHAWAVRWRGSDWFADVENSRLVSKQEEDWGGWSTGRLDESPEVWNVQGREYLLDASGRLLRLDVRAGRWRALFGGQTFRSIHPVPRSSSGIASEQTQFIARSQGKSSTWKHLQLGQSEREYPEIILKPNTEPSYDSERFLGLTPDGQEFIEYTWKSHRRQRYKRSVSESAKVLARASDTSVWAEQGSLLREINLSSGQWSSSEIDTKPGSVSEVAGENDLLLYEDASSARPYLVRSGRTPRMLSRATSGYQLVDGWDAVGISDGSDKPWQVSDGETSFRVPHKIPCDIGEVQSTFVEDNNLLVVSDKGVSKFVDGKWLDVTRSLPVEMGVVGNRWCYLQNGTLLDQNKMPLPGYSGVRAIFSSPGGTLVVNRDWRCTWHNMTSGRTKEILEPDNYLHQQYQDVSNAVQYPPQGTARFLTWSSQGKSYVHLPDGNSPQQFNGPPPTIWLSPSHPELPVFNQKLNIISAKSQSGEPELITPSSAYYATEDMLFRDGDQIQDSKQTITVRALRSSSGTEFLRIPTKSAELNFVRSDSGAWIFEDLSEWIEQKLAGTSATLVKAKDDDSVGFFTDEVGRTQEVKIKSFDQIDDNTLNTVLNDVFGSNADRIPNTFCDRVFVQFDSGATDSYQIIESSSITRLRSDVVPVNSSSRTLPYVIGGGQVGIRHEGDFLPKFLWDRVPAVVRGGQKTWGNFNPFANGVVSATNWIRSTRLPIGVEWIIDSDPQIQRGNRVGIPTVWSSTSLSGHLSLGSNPNWSGDPRKGMVHQGRPLGKLKPQGFESHLRMRRKEFIPVSYQGSLGVVRVVDDQLWLQSEGRWQELPREMESKVIRGLSSEVTLRPSTNPNEPVNGTLLRWKPSTNEIGCDQGANFYRLSLADFSQPAPFVCARPSGFGYRSAREDNVVFSYSLSGQDYQSASGNLTFPNVLELLRQQPAQPSRTTASVPNPLPPSRIQNVNSSFVRSDGRFALAWHLVDQVRPTRTASNSVVISKGSGSNYVIRADGNVQGARPLRPLPSWSDADGLPFRPAAEASRWEIQLPTSTGLRRWIPAGTFDRGNFALLQLDDSAELRKFDDDVWIIRHGGFSLGWSESASDFVAAPGLGISAPEFTTQCGSYEVSIENGQFGRISHSDIGLVVFDVNSDKNPSEVTSGGWLPQFEPQNIQYVQSVSAAEKGDADWCIQLPDNSWVTVDEDSMRWKRSGPPRGQVDSPVLRFGLLVGLSRKQIRERRIETPLNIDLGVFEFEIPDQLQVGFDEESRIIVIADDQKFMVDRSFGIKLLPEAKISVVQPEVDPASSNLVLGLTPTALEAGGTTYELKRDGRLAWSPYPGLTFQESEQSGVFDHNRVLRAFFTTASNRYLTTFDGGFVVRGPEALSICSDGLVEFQRDLDGELHASISVDCETSFGTDYQSSISPAVMRRTYAVSAGGWVQPDQGFIEADGRLPNSRLGWIGVYPNGVAEIVGDRSRLLTRDQSGISKPKNSFKDLPGEIFKAQHLNGGLFVESPERSFAVELSEHLGLGVEGLRSVRHDWSPAYQAGLTISTQSIQTKDGRHIVTTKSSRRRPTKSGVLEEPASVDLATFRSHAMEGVTTVLGAGEPDGLRLYILGSLLSRIDFDKKTGSSEFVKMFDPESSDQIAVSSSGEVYLRADGADWLGLLNDKPIGEDQLGSRWVNDTLEAFSGTFDWTLWEDPNGVLKYSSTLHDSLKNRALSEDLIPEWPWDRLVASGFDFDTYPYWSSTKLHLRRSTGFPSSSGSLSQQKITFTHARQKEYSEQGSAHIPVECPFPSSPSIPSRNFPSSGLLQDGSLALDIENQAPVMIDLSSDLRYPVDFGDGPDTPAANAERIDDDLWILTQRGQLRWVPIMQEWLQQLVVEDQQGGAAAGTTEPSNSFTQEESEGSEADSRSLVEQVEEQSGNLEAERLPVGENIQPPGDMEKNTSPARMSRTVKIGMYSNMHFSVGRFVAQTGERLTVEFENDDPQAQPHNLVFTKPGRRMKVFTDMMRMGPKAVGSGYIPTKSRSVLKEGDEVVAISLLNPGESGSVTFTAPDKVGAYPFACIYPGHQVSMYGVMHVVEDPAAVELPAEDADPGIPPGWIEANTAAKATEQKLQGTRRRLPF